jgi:hypothetical protein
MRKHANLHANTWTKNSRHAVHRKCRLPRAGRPSSHYGWYSDHPSVERFINGQMDKKYGAARMH